MPYQIPISPLPEPPYYVYAHNTVIPVLIVTEKGETFIRRRVDMRPLGDELTDISSRLTPEQVKQLCDLEGLRTVQL